MQKGKTNTVRTCDLFCHVIDNFGDAAVSWRLARQLAFEYSWKVRLIIDDITPLCALTGIPFSSKYNDASLISAKKGSIQVTKWSQEIRANMNIDMIIAAFSCNLNHVYENSLSGILNTCNKQVLWINLEYLSLEDWTLNLHGCQSPHSYLPISKVFFFPGFDERSGGLLHESDLEIRLNTVDSNRLDTWKRIGLPAVPPIIGKIRIVSLFSYSNPAIHLMINSWLSTGTPIILLIPKSYACQEVSNILGKTLDIHDTVQVGTITIHVLPFLIQDDYDCLLRLADLNFVRGEDSFIRAQFAGRPFCWQIYPQEGGAHFFKLEAFLKCYTADANTLLSNSIIEYFNNWNNPNTEFQNAISWRNIEENWNAWQSHAINWGNNLLKQPSLATNLVKLLEEKL